MKKTLLSFALIIFLLLSGCAQEKAELALDQPVPDHNCFSSDTLTDNIPFSDAPARYRYNNRTYLNRISGDRAYVISVADDNPHDAVCLLQGGHIYGQLGSLLLIAGNQQFIAVDLQEDAPRKIPLCALDETDQFLLGYPRGSNYVILLTDGTEQIVIRSDSVVAERKRTPLISPILQPTPSGDHIYFLQKAPEDGYYFRSMDFHLKNHRTFGTVQADRFAGINEDWAVFKTTDKTTDVIQYFDLQNNGATYQVQAPAHISLSVHGDILSGGDGATGLTWYYNMATGEKTDASAIDKDDSAPNKKEPIELNERVYETSPLIVL